MSERKVLSKYIPPDFDPSQIKRVKGIKSDKLPTVRLMTPFSMQCKRCGAFIPKAKKFNARKQSPFGEKYLGIQIHRFFFKCPSCAGELVFSTDPKSNDYKAEGETKRLFEPWRENHVEESVEDRLNRLEAEEAEENEEVDPMLDLEAKMAGAQQEMAVADALDEIRVRKAKQEKAALTAQADPVVDPLAEIRKKEQEEDEEAAKLAFQQKEIVQVVEEVPFDPPKSTAPTFKKVVKPKKNFSAALGIKKKS